MKTTPIRNLEELLSLSTGKPLYCRIRLNYGCYSRKILRTHPRSRLVCIHHHIDDSTSDHYPAQLLADTNTGQALRNRVLYREVIQ